MHEMTRSVNLVDGQKQLASLLELHFGMSVSHVLMHFGTEVGHGAEVTVTVGGAAGAVLVPVPVPGLGAGAAEQLGQMMETDVVVTVDTVV